MQAVLIIVIVYAAGKVVGEFLFQNYIFSLYILCVMYFEYIFTLYFLSKGLNRLNIYTY